MQRANSLKRSRRPAVVISLLLVALVALVGCAPRATGGELAAAAEQEQIIVDLPALVIDIQENGQASIGQQSLAELGNLVGQGQALADLSVPPETVDFLTASNIQHIQVDNTSQGLLILINGQPVPSLAWDGEQLVATARTLEQFGAGVTLLDRVLPLIQQLGVGVIIRFPLAEGEEAIPFESLDDEVAQEAARLQEEFLNAVGTPPTLQLVVQYAEDGTWSVEGLTPEQWSQIAPIPWESMNLPPNVIQGASNAGIEQITLSTDNRGIFISINDQILPYITWEDGRINHLLRLAEQTGMLEPVMGSDPNMQALMDTVESLLPAVQASNISLTVQFP